MTWALLLILPLPLPLGLRVRGAGLAEVVLGGREAGMTMPEETSSKARGGLSRLSRLSGLSGLCSVPRRVVSCQGVCRCPLLVVSRVP